MSRVNVDFMALCDSRFSRLAHEMGLADAAHALGFMIRVWAECTMRGTETLQGFELTAASACVPSSSPENGVADALVQSDLAEEISDDLYRIKGCTGRIEWLTTLRNNGKYGKLGGRPKKPDRVPKEKPSRVSKNNPAGGQKNNPTSPALAPAPMKGGAERATAFQATVDLFHSLHSETYGHPPTWKQKAHFANLKRLIKQHTPEEVQRRIHIAFSDPPQFPPPPYDFDSFTQHFDKFVRGGSEFAQHRANGKPDPSTSVPTRGERVWIDGQWQVQE